MNVACLLFRDWAQHRYKNALLSFAASHKIMPVVVLFSAGFL